MCLLNRRVGAVVLVAGVLGAAAALHAATLPGAVLTPTTPASGRVAGATAGALCRPSRSPGQVSRDTVSVACARSGQGYPFSLGTEYIAVSPASAPVGAVLRVWGSCGCGESAAPATGIPVEMVRVWLLGTGRRTVAWRGRHVIVNDGRALLAQARIDSHSNWNARVSVPWRIGAGFGLSRQIDTAAGSYAIMVTYPGEDAGAEYYAVAPREGYITAFAITRPAHHA